MGYAIKCSHNDILQAELDARIHGLILCKDQGFFLEAEVDYEIAFNIIMRRTMEAW